MRWGRTAQIKLRYTYFMTKQQRLVLLVSILASFVPFLDGSVITVALPAITHDLGGGLVLQQWAVDSYLITLGALMLVAGSFSDLFGHKKILISGLIGFGTASVLCALAPTGEFLIIARGLQGVAGALLVPSSLALIISAFSGGGGEGKAVGTWTAWASISYVIGPLLGGFLVDTLSWRYIFAINLLPILVTLWLMRSLKESVTTHKNTQVDYVGATACIFGLGGTVYALIEQAHYGWASPYIYLPLVGGLIALIYFVWHEHRTPQPMLPLSLFKVRNFSVGNIATVSIYAGLSIATFIISVFIQQVGGYTAVQAGLALLPITIIMFFLSSQFGALAGKYGPRIFMAVGPLLAAIGFLSMLRVDESAAYWSQLFPGVLIFGVGLSVTVAPLTSAIFISISTRQAGIGSAINNAVSRIAGLIAIAALGVLTGPSLDLAGFRRGIIATAALLVAGGVISAIGIQNPHKDILE
jgi:EmrB/QacA subfamily drug resistance transporter